MFIRDCGIKDTHEDHTYLHMWRKKDFYKDEIPGNLLFCLPSEWVVEYRCFGKDSDDG